MKRISILLIVIAVTNFARAESPQVGRVELFCHRTANKDVTENTLESLEQAALLGCNVVEIDLRRTLDGKIILNHDGYLERLTDGIGEVETTYYDDLRLRDAGSWMGERFAGMHVTLFEDALRLARQRDIRLILDIKTKDMGADVLQILQREGMLQRVQFNGEWDDVKKLYPRSADAGSKTVWVAPGVTKAQVDKYHREGKAVVANFSANQHDMDLAGMKAAVAAGVDGINVDYPRLGADAVGRPVERRLHALALRADVGESGVRAAAILELARYRGFPLQDEFAHWLLDADNHVSRAAALALVIARPKTQPAIFTDALKSPHADARANAAWGLGMLEAPADTVLPLLKDKDSQVLQETLIALMRMPGEVSPDLLLPLLSNSDPAVRGAAALALARHQPEIAASEVPAQLRREMATERKIYGDQVSNRIPHFTQPEIDLIVQSFRCQMEMLRVMRMLKQDNVTQELWAQVLESKEPFLEPNRNVAGFDLWDRVGADDAPAIQALGATDAEVADRAEWILIKGGKQVLPEIRKALDSKNAAVRMRAIQIVAWQGDTESLARLRAMRTKGKDGDLAEWAIVTIESLHPKL